MTKNEKAVLTLAGGLVLVTAGHKVASGAAKTLGLPVLAVTVLGALLTWAIA